MESLNFIKGYDKVNSLENPNNLPPKSSTINNNNRRKFIAISGAILFTLVICSLIAALIHEYATEEHSDQSPIASNSINSLRTVCSVTRYPDSCFSSISPLNTPPSNNPLRFFNLSLHATATDVSRLKNLLTESNNEPAVKDCAELFDDAVSQLDRSAELMRVGPGEKVLNEMKISDLKTWISAAMTDLDTCLDGMEEMGSTAVVEFKVKVHKSQEYMSNSLAILSNIQSLFDKCGLTMP